MEQIQIQLPDKVASDVRNALDAGWFNSLDDLVRAALVEYLDLHRLNLLDQQQLADVEWAKRLSQKKLAGC